MDSKTNLNSEKINNKEKLEASECVNEIEDERTKEEKRRRLDVECVGGRTKRLPDRVRW